MASTNLHPPIWSAARPAQIIASMSPKDLGKTYIKEWRLFRGMRQEQLADAIGITTASLSRIENGKQPYNQRQVEQLAEALRCSPGELISSDPNQSRDDIVDILQHIPAEKRAQARQILETFTDKKKA